MKRFWLFLFLVFSVYNTVLGQTEEDARAIQSIAWKEKNIASGIVLKQCEKVVIFGKLQSISILEIDTALAQVDFQVDYEKSGFHPVSVFGHRNNAIAAINGTYFMTTGTNMYTPWHFIKIDGKVISKTVNNEFSTRATGVMTVTDGIVDLSTWNKEKEALQAQGSQYALVCGPLLLDNGQECEIWNPDPSNTSGTNFVGINPRSCVAHTADGKVLLITVDGRQASRAVGMSLRQLQFFTQAIGCTDALNLDGGGSSALYVQGEERHGIVNVPIDENVSGKERNVGNVLYIVPKGSSKPFCIGGKTPGGLSSKNLRLWIKANEGVAIGNNKKLVAPYITDHTGYHEWTHYSQSANSKIELQGHAINHYPALRFDSASALVGKTRVKYSTFFSVNTLNSKGMLLGFNESGSAYTKPREFLLAASNRVYVHDGTVSTGYASVPYQAYDKSFNLFSTSFGKSSDTFVVNGQEQLTEISNHNQRDNLHAFIHIGARNTYPAHIPGKVDYFLRGDVAEIIAFEDTLTKSETERVESYLAMKYGITIENPNYIYQSSTGVRWWNGNSTSFKPFSHYITFIGRDDASGLLQRQAQSIGNRVLPSSESLLTIEHIGEIPTDQYFVTVGSTLEPLNQLTEQEGYRLMARHWKFNVSALQSLPLNIHIDLPEGLSHNEQQMGILLVKGTSKTFYPGTLNTERKRMSVSNVVIPKSSEMYLVVNGIANGISTTTDIPSLHIEYANNQQVTLVGTEQSNESYSLCIYTLSGKLVGRGWQQMDVSRFQPGIYIAVAKDKYGKTWLRRKITISQ